MTREKFCAIHARRGYEVENLGLITFLRAPVGKGKTYTAIWFWNADGTLNEAERPTWTIN